MVKKTDTIKITYSWKKYKPQEDNKKRNVIYHWLCKNKKQVNIGESVDFHQRLGNYFTNSEKKGQTNKDWFKLNKKNIKGLKILSIQDIKITINNKKYILNENKNSFLRKFIENYFSLIEKKDLFNKSGRSKK
jgi:hypothetical protein